MFRTTYVWISLASTTSTINICYYFALSSPTCCKDSHTSFKPSPSRPPTPSRVVTRHVMTNSGLFPYQRWTKNQYHSMDDSLEYQAELSASMGSQLSSASIADLSPTSHFDSESSFTNASSASTLSCTPSSKMVKDPFSPSTQVKI